MSRIEPCSPGASVALAFIVFSCAALAGTTGKISGRVLDKATKQALASVNVVIVGTSLGAPTDLDGYYNIINIPPGTYNVEFRLIGYGAYSVTGIPVTADRTTKIDAELEEAATTAGEVVVVAQRPVVDVNLTSTVSTVTDKQIQALPVQELKDIVNLQAGVVDGHFRGGRAGEVQYQVNGVSVNNPYDNSSTVRIDRSVIQEVQVITGTFDAEYGQAMSGVVNAVLKSGSDQIAVTGEALSGAFFYASGGLRNLTYQFRPEFLNQNYQLSVTGPTGIPQTYFLFSGRRSVFNDYYLGERRFNPLDTNGISNPHRWLLQPNGDGKIVALAYSHEWSGLAKVTNRSIPEIEISYQALFNVIDASKIDDAFIYRLNPDGKKTQRTTSVVHGVDWTHTISSTTFYNLSVRQNYFDYHDWVFEDFYDPRYDYARSSTGSSDYEYGAVVAGVDFGRFRQRTTALVLKAALTSQVMRDHLIKLGGEFQTSAIYFGTAGTLTYKGDTLYRYVDQPPDYPGVQYYHPISLAAYGQDQMEWNDLTIRAGLRFELFDARSFLPSDLANPANAISGAPASFPQRTSKKVSAAPRIGISYPITATSSVFFSYGHFYQLPPLRDIFNNANYDKLARLQAGAGEYGTVYGNPDIKPERTVQYEFGYKHALTDFLGLNVNLFYKDIRDLLGVELIDTYSAASYPRLTNVDFGSVTGFTISLDQRPVGILSSTIDYTWQMAQGNSSDPIETATRAAAGEDPRPRQIPLNWDQRNTINATVTLSKQKNYSLSTILRFAGGQPYTPAHGSGFGASLGQNSGRKPSGFLVDLRGEKYFTFAGASLSFFARVFNVFDARYFNGHLFSDTGSPDYGLFPFSQDRDLLADPTRYYPPRRIEVGISMNSL
ncbi:MAG: TonB-dependent receptor [Ignavibacteria bacterium]|nr:MAG: TonB-dependent receptor [Ignavibacteria bacterium]